MEKIILDGGLFTGVDLTGKTLIFNGGTIPVLRGATLGGTSFELGEAAARTLAFVVMLDTMSPGYAAQLLQEVRRDLRKWLPPATN